MKRFLGSQGFVTLAGVATVAVLTVAGYLVAVNPLRQNLSYCAIMPDAVGLYQGNHVTMLGIPVGTVTAVEPEGTAVRVDFSIDASHPLRGAVTATTVSDTLVADRALEVLGDSTSDAPWRQDTCITKTFTPKSITQTLEAFSNLADQLTGHGDPAEQARLRTSVSLFDQATAGTGQKLNQLVRDLGTALNSPNAAIGHLGTMIDAFAEIAASVAIKWEDIKVALTQAEEGVGFINEVWGSTVQIVDSLLVILPWFNDIFRKHGQPILRGLDAAIPKVKLLGAGISGLQKLLDMIPPLVTAFQQSLDPETGQVRVTYRAPNVALPQDNAEQLCTLADTVRPGSCRRGDNGPANVSLVPLVLGMAGAR
ncbi:MCE family protein [Nocardia sp. 2]|uniref:MCE family protein n=1 Tax=Nocardia acididurans TaxID=2802282 RepID=A0ABS1MFI1_9NOCA|nr:MlaD family protein [Nocardia acididurans]MBL1079407.1 MCE family protein [Nocardia acididurans]